MARTVVTPSPLLKSPDRDHRAVLPRGRGTPRREVQLGFRDAQPAQLEIAPLRGPPGTSFNAHTRTWSQNAA
jgi:hypothetical protein